MALSAATSDALDPTLHTILGGLRQLGAIPQAGIVVLDGQSPERPPAIALELPARHGKGSAPLTEPLLARVITSGQTVVIEDGACDERSPPAPWRALIALPLLVGGEVVGVLYAADTQSRPFAATERPLLETLAEHASGAIARSRLRARERDLAVSDERNRLAREIHDHLAQDLLAILLQLEATAGHLPDDPGVARDGVRRAAATTRGAQCAGCVPRRSNAGRWPRC